MDLYLKSRLKRIARDLGWMIHFNDRYYRSWIVPYATPCTKRFNRQGCIFYWEGKNWYQYETIEAELYVLSEMPPEEVERLKKKRVGIYIEGLEQ